MINVFREAQYCGLKSSGDFAAKKIDQKISLMQIKILWYVSKKFSFKLDEQILVYQNLPFVYNDLA